MKTKYYKQRGFTLLELMTIITLIGILAALALPFYQTYITRTRIVEVVLFAGTVKTRLWEEHLIHGSLPENLSTTAQFLEQVMYGSHYAGSASYQKIDNNNANLQITFQNMKMDNVNGKTMIFSFEVTSRRIVEGCKGGDLEDIYRPPACRDHG